MIKKIENYFKANFWYVVVVFGIGIINFIYFLTNKTNFFEFTVLMLLEMFYIEITYKYFKIDPPKVFTHEDETFMNLTEEQLTALLKYQSICRFTPPKEEDNK